MKYFNVEKFLKVLSESRSEPAYPGRWYVVLNAKQHHEDLRGLGPMSTAFAQCISTTEEWDKEGNLILNWVNEDGKPLTGQDFRDWSAHNVGRHDGKVTHWFDGYDIGCLLHDLMKNQE